MLNEAYNVIGDHKECDTFGTYRSYIDTWWQWYEGSVDGFHEYSENVLGQMKAFQRYTLNSAKSVSEAWSELLTREPFEMIIDDEKMQSYVEYVLEKENFGEMLPKYLELAFATSTAWMVEYIADNEVFIDYINVDYGTPISYRNGIITGLAVVNTYKQGKMFVTHIQYHESLNDNYVITNEAYASEDEGQLGKPIDIAKLNIKDIDIPNTTPWFQTMKPNIANNIDPASPFGISIFNKNIDTLKAIDKKYTEFDCEFELGKKRIVVGSAAMQKELDEETNQFVSYVSTTDRAYQAVSSDEFVMKEIDFTLREQAYINALNKELAFLADGVGMDEGSFVYNGSSMKTATEVISEKSKTFGHKKKHDKMLLNVLYGVVNSIISAKGYIDGVDYSNIEVTITLSDNILVDDDAKRLEERADVIAGNMPKKLFLMRNYGLDSDTADIWLAQIAKESQIVDIETTEGLFMND